MPPCLPPETDIGPPCPVRCLRADVLSDPLISSSEYDIAGRIQRHHHPGHVRAESRHQPGRSRLNMVRSVSSSICPPCRICPNPPLMPDVRNEMPRPRDDIV